MVILLHVCRRGEVWIEAMQVVCPLDSYNHSLYRSQQAQRKHKHCRYRPIKVHHRFNLIACFKVKNSANNDMTNNGHCDVWRGVIRSVVVKGFAATRTARVHPKIAFKQFPLSAFGALADYSIFHCSPNAALGLINRVYFNAHLAFPIVCFGDRQMSF